ncbi:MAG: hypothetical protein KAI67_06170 [Candidatus Pacebacteria bacterium]|nr:hypothetical protein [Candidatus Paceibacterota bacterium]
MAQHSLGNFIGLTPDGRAIYSNVEWMKLDKKGNLHCGGENIFDFELNKFSMRGYQLRVEKHINPIYDVPAFLEINNSPHDVVRYEHQFVYAKHLWLKEFLVQSENSTVEVERTIIEKGIIGEWDGITVTLTGVLEDISQFLIVKKDNTVQITKKPRWEHIASPRTFDNSNWDSRYCKIVEEIQPKEFEKRKVVLDISVPEGATQDVWNERGYRK